MVREVGRKMLPSLINFRIATEMENSAEKDI
jgi:hypothetical protein